MLTLGYELRYIGTGDPLYAEAREVRYDCLYAEWDLPRSLIDDTDGRVYKHLVALEEDCVIGYARLHLEGEDSKILQLSVAAPHRGRGVAVALMRELMHHAQMAGREEVYLDAREHVIGFYEKLGFDGEGDMFLSPRTHTPHLKMRRSVGDF